VKRVAVLQSNYIPWKGYFDIIGGVDEFIFYDDVQYTKNDWRNRNRIKTPRGSEWLTIPVFQKNLGQKIIETKTASSNWRRKHWKTIQVNYARSPYFKTFKDVFEELYLHSSETQLSKINEAFIRTINTVLGITTELKWSGDYRLKGDKNERLVSLLKQADADIYISGPSARNYLDEALFREENIAIEWMDYSGYPEYYQPYPPFDHFVSIIDLIFNQGHEATLYMKFNRTGQ